MLQPKRVSTGMIWFSKFQRCGVAAVGTEDADSSAMQQGQRDAMSSASSDAVRSSHHGLAVYAVCELKLG
jgi:hypothetical protein